jgi:Cu-processing system permease protein
MPAFVIARLTLLEASRRRIMLAALLLGLAFLLLDGVGFYVMQHEIRPPVTASGPMAVLFRNEFASFMAVAGLYAVNFLVVAMAALVTADTLAGEISSGTIQAIVAKPLRRSEIVLGKWLGLAGLLALYLLLMAGGVTAVTYASAGYVVPNVLTAWGLMYLEGLLVVTITLACSSTISTLATGGVVFGLYGLAFIGGWVEQIGGLAQSRAAVNIGIISSLIMPSEALWHRASFEMTPRLAQVLGMAMSGPFVNTSVPSPLMVAYAALYLVAALAFAVGRFSRRDL